MVKNIVKKAAESWNAFIFLYLFVYYSMGILHNMITLMLFDVSHISLTHSLMSNLLFLN